MARSKDKDARLIEQLARGRRTRYTASVNFSVAEARTNNTAPNRIMADAIKNETVIKPVFVSPCNCKVVRIVANGSPFVDLDVGGSTNVKLTKDVIGAADVDLCSNIAVGAATVPTLGTAIDGTLSTTANALDLLDGQHVYATIVVSNHTVETAVAYVTVTLEYVPTDAGYPRD